jgi:hypothetical protein
MWNSKKHLRTAARRDCSGSLEFMRGATTRCLVALLAAALLASCGGGGGNGCGASARPGGSPGGGSGGSGEPPPLSAGRVEEHASVVVLSEGWTTVTQGWFGWSGGTAVQAAAPGTTARFTFTGTSVSWIGARTNQSGIAKVTIDGGAPVNVDLFAHNFEVNNPVYSVYGLAAGTHTITVEPTGTKNAQASGTTVVVDAFVAPAPVVSHLQETDPAVVFTPALTASKTWAQADDRLGWSGGGLATLPDPPVGGAKITATAGYKATVHFRGTAASWIGFRGPTGGIALVSIDDAASVEVDTYAVSEIAQATLFTASDMADTDHTLTIEVTGTKNPAASAANIVVDAFDVVTPGRRYEEMDPAVVYSDGWIFKNLNRTWSEGSISESSDQLASVTFTFTGTSVSWIGCRKLSTGSANIYLDGVFVESVQTYLAPPMEAYQTPIYRVDNLAPGVHTLKIENTGNGAYTVIDAFDVR